MRDHGLYVRGMGGPNGLNGSSGAHGIRELARRHALLPLRIFLGVTFVYAGLDKLTDSAFLSANGPGSVSYTHLTLPTICSV